MNGAHTFADHCPRGSRQRPVVGSEPTQQPDPSKLHPQSPNREPLWRPSDRAGLAYIEPAKLSRTICKVGLVQQTEQRLQRCTIAVTLPHQQIEMLGRK